MISIRFAASAAAIGFALVAIPAAACNLQADERYVNLDRTNIPGEQFSASSVVEGFAEPLINTVPAFSENDCTVAEVRAALFRVNGWTAEQMLPRTARMQLVTPVAQEASESEAAQAVTGDEEVAAARAAVEEARTATAAAERERDRARRELQAATNRQGAISLDEVRRLTQQLRSANQLVAEMRQLETAAKASAEAAARSATAAATSERNAAGSASDAAGSATAADTSEAGAAESAVAAEAAADRAEAATGWSFWDWVVAVLAALSAIGVGGVVVWVKKTRRSNKQANAMFATKTEIVTIEVDGPVFERLNKLDDSEAEMLNFSTSDGRTFEWPFGRKDGKWYTSKGSADHNSQHDLISDPAKTLQKWARKGQITI
jgi:hypothetical protein